MPLCALLPLCSWPGCATLCDGVDSVAVGANVVPLAATIRLYNNKQTKQNTTIQQILRSAASFCHPCASRQETRGGLLLPPFRILFSNRCHSLISCTTAVPIPRQLCSSCLLLIVLLSASISSDCTSKFRRAHATTGRRDCPSVVRGIVRPTLLAAMRSSAVPCLATLHVCSSAQWQGHCAAVLAQRRGSPRWLQPRADALPVSSILFLILSVPWWTGGLVSASLCAATRSTPATPISPLRSLRSLCHSTPSPLVRARRSASVTDPVAGASASGARRE